MTLKSRHQSNLMFCVLCVENRVLYVVYCVLKIVCCKFFSLVGGFKLGEGASDVHLQILQWGVKERKGNSSHVCASRWRWRRVEEI